MVLQDWLEVPAQPVPVVIPAGLALWDGPVQVAFKVNEDSLVSRVIPDKSVTRDSLVPLAVLVKLDQWVFQESSANQESKVHEVSTVYRVIEDRPVIPDQPDLLVSLAWLVNVDLRVKLDRPDLPDNRDLLDQMVSQEPQDNVDSLDSEETRDSLAIRVRPDLLEGLDQLDLWVHRVRSENQVVLEVEDWMDQEAIKDLQVCRAFNFILSTFYSVTRICSRLYEDDNGPIMAVW